jgi:Organic solute transporter Ostalpha
MPSWVESPAALAIAVVATVVATALSLFNIIKHAKNYNSPRTQKYIFRILGVIPVYAVCSCVSVIAPSVAVVFLTLRDVYEAFVVYSFFTLILEYAGGDYNCTERIKHLPPVPHPPPLCCLPAVRRDAHLLRLTKQGVVQFVVLKPIMAALSLAALAGGKYYSTGWQVTLLLVYNTTYSIALYCLLLFYLAIRTLLTPFQPVQKFFAVKGELHIPQILHELLRLLL